MSDGAIDRNLAAMIKNEPIEVDIVNTHARWRPWLVAVGLEGFLYHTKKCFTKRGAKNDAVRAHNRMRSLIDSMG